jgi:hypothetical protein
MAPVDKFHVVDHYLQTWKNYSPRCFHCKIIQDVHNLFVSRTECGRCPQQLLQVMSGYVRWCSALGTSSMRRDCPTWCASREFIIVATNTRSRTQNAAESGIHLVFRALTERTCAAASTYKPSEGVLADQSHNTLSINHLPSCLAIHQTCCTLIDSQTKTTSSPDRCTMWYSCPFYNMNTWVSGGYQEGMGAVSPEYHAGINWKVHVVDSLWTTLLKVFSGWRWRARNFLL